MANELIPIGQAQAPAALQARRAQGLTTNQNFADGVRDAFPLLSIKGKVFRVRIGGQETAFVDPQTRQAMGALDIVLVNSSRALSKSYYIAGYTEGEMNPPDCWSLDSIRPDPSVANKVSLTCVNCPMNAFGSKITDAGKSAKACQDARRVAIVMPHNLGDPDPLLMLFRVPQTSLKNLKAYAQLLDRSGFDPNSCITRVTFDYQEAYPKLLFNFVAPLTDGEYAKALELAESPNTASMLNAPDFDPAISTIPRQADNTQGMVRQAGPVLENPGVAAQVLRTGPVLETTQQVLPSAQELQAQAAARDQQQAALQVVPAGLIELPDGRLYDPQSKTYVERTQPAVQMAEKDPTTIELPGGEFFNTVTKQYVTGPNKGDPVRAAAPAKATRARGPNKPKEPVATGNQQSNQPAPQNQPPVQQTQAEASVDASTKAQLDMLVGGAVQKQKSGDSGDNDPEPASNGAIESHTVTAAPSNLESVLTDLLANKSQ